MERRRAIRRVSALRAHAHGTEAPSRRALVPLLVLALAATDAVLYVTSVHGLERPSGSVTIPWWLLAGLFVVMETFPAHVYFRSEAQSVSLNELPLVLGLYFASPGSLLLAYVLGVGLTLAFFRRQRPIKLAFNVSQFVLAICVAELLFRPFLRLGDAYGPAGWAGAVAAALAAGTVTLVLTFTVIWLSSGSAKLRTFPSLLPVTVLGSVAAASIAIACVELIGADARAIWVLAVPGVGSLLALRALAAQRRSHEHLEFLYRSMRSLQAAPDLRGAVHELLRGAQTILAADYAEALLFDFAPDGATVRSVVDAGGVRLLEPVEPGECDRRALAAVAAGEEGVLLPRLRDPHPLDEYLAARGLDDALLVALRDERRVFGLLLVGERADDVSTFSASDRALFETFASHAGVLLEHERVKEELRRQAFHDALTGLPNRALFARRVGDALARGSGGASVLFLDLDDFKTINDSFGHDAGDRLLVEVARRIRARIRPGDTAARLGGDEFGVLLEDAADGEAERTAERLVEALLEPIPLDGHELPVHASVGIADTGSGASTVAELLRNADMAMYAAKSDGERRHAVYEPAMHARVRARHELTSALERAVEREEICAYFQPIVDLESGATAGVEALARWRHPEHGVVAAAEFVPLAEELHLMAPIGRVVLREACRRVQEWRRLAPLFLCVNLSPSELLDPRLADDVAAVLAESGLPPEQLVLEITESGAMRDPRSTAVTFNELRRLGVRLALDDFGTGYSSLSHMRDFPIHTLKIAKPFVDRLDSHAPDASFIEAILGLAAALELDVVAEGIERPEQAAALAQLGCDLGQGYHYAPPLDAEALERYLAPARAATAARAA